MPDREAPPPGPTPLDPSGYAFSGFSDLRGRLERKIRRAGLWGGEPSVSLIEDAVFVPAANRRIAGQLDLYGGLVTREGWPLNTLRRGGDKLVGGLVGPVAIQPRREVDEEVVYLGWLFDAFGHVLLESLARTWFLEEVDPAVRVVFHAPSSARWSPPDSVLRILDAFGVPLARILWLDVPTRLRRVIVPEPLFELQYAAHPRLTRPFRAVAEGFAGDGIPSSQPLYLSRRLLASSQRPVVGEAELEHVLRENGFLIVHPETIPFDDQVRLFNSHTDIFASLGSAAHTVLFALTKPRLHLLTNGDRISLNYFLCSALAAAPTTFINGLGTAGRPFVEGAPTHTPEIVDIAALVRYLDQRGFMKTRPAASMATAASPPRVNYDEPWLYARVRSATSRRETLPAGIEEEALRVAASSWPLSLMLARYDASTADGGSRVDDLAEQFARLALAEADTERLAHYRAEIASLARDLVATCRSETVTHLCKAMADRFQVALVRDPDPD